MYCADLTQGQNTIIFCLPSAPEDFGSLSTVVTFDPSTAGSSVVQVNIVEDEVVEEREVFRARLRVPSDQSGVVLGQEDITVTIVEDDGKFEDLSFNRP